MLRDLNIQTVHIFTRIKTYFHKLFQPQCKHSLLSVMWLQWQRLKSCPHHFEQLKDKVTKVSACVSFPTPLNDAKTCPQSIVSICPCLPHVTIFSSLLSVDNFVVRTVQSGAEGGRVSNYSVQFVSCLAHCFISPADVDSSATPCADLSCDQT